MCVLLYKCFAILTKLPRCLCSLSSVTRRPSVCEINSNLILGLLHRACGNICPLSACSSVTGSRGNVRADRTTWGETPCCSVLTGQSVYTRRADNRVNTGCTNVQDVSLWSTRAEKIKLVLSLLTKNRGLLPPPPSCFVS